MKFSDKPDDTRYQKQVAVNIADFEALCLRCGECCGAFDGDPCLQLQFDPGSGDYYCRDYENRLGPQKTISGVEFECVPIIQNLKRGCYHEKCAYRILYR